MLDQTLTYGRDLPITHQLASSTCHLAYTAKAQEAKTTYYWPASMCEECDHSAKYYTLTSYCHIL